MLPTGSSMKSTGLSTAPPAGTPWVVFTHGALTGVMPS
jgi:hypothetical protein